MKIAIIGMGIVGKAQARMFKDHDLVTYDPAYRKEYPSKEIADCDFAVIAVGTPEMPDGSAYMRSFWEALHKLPWKMPVLIRSTVPPGTTAGIEREGHTVFCPEFMHERTGGIWRESSDVPWLVLGGQPDATSWFANRVFWWHRNVYQCDSTTAEVSKYVANIYWAVRVTFVNEMSSVCDRFGLSWEDVRRAWLQDERVNPAYTAIDGFPPGFGGRCLPKDLSALIYSSMKAGYDPEFLIAVQDANERFTDESMGLCPRRT